MRRALVILVVLGLAGLAIVDLARGHWQVGIASLCLTVANGIFLSQ